jgi:hypothetical protein
VKIRLTKKQLIALINEDIGSFEHTQGTVHWLLNKPKCAAYLDKNALPDSFLAIFFGDQMIGAGAELTPMINQSFLNKAISQDTIMSKLQSPDAVARANKINPSQADTIRRWLGTAIDFAFPIGSDVFCKQIADTVDWVKSMGDIFGLGFGGAAAGAAGVGAAGVGMAAASSVDLSQELTACFDKVSKTEYMGKLNQGRVTGVDAMDFFFFPFSMSALSTGNVNQLTKAVIEQDLTNLQSKVRDVKALSPVNSLFTDYFERVFHNPVTRTSRDAELICKAEIESANQKLSSPDAARFLKDIAVAMKEDYQQKVNTKIERFQQIIVKVPDGIELLKLIPKYSVR